VSAPAVDATEYARFGPWIDEVVSPADVPRLFRDHPVDLEGARLVLKVPRDIARRDATPGMDLYDHLIVLDADVLTVLSRRRPAPRSKAPAPQGYDVVTVPLPQVVAIRDVVNLLQGRLTIHAQNGTELSVDYNGSARTNVSRLVRELRASSAQEAPSSTGRALLEAGGLARASRGGATGRLDPGNDDLALLSDYLEIARRAPQVSAWTCHGRTQLTPGGRGIGGVVQRALHALSPMMLHGAILAADGVALEVVARHEWLVRGRTPVHATSRLVVPLGSVDAVELARHPLYDGAVVATVTAGGTRIEILVPTGSDAHRLLAAAAPTRPTTASLS
jgi:hypothetical protein